MLGSVLLDLLFSIALVFQVAFYLFAIKVRKPYSLAAFSPFAMLISSAYPLYVGEWLQSEHCSLYLHPSIAQCCLDTPIKSWRCFIFGF